MQHLSFPLVSVVMITYAHENYIQEAIEGIFLQQFNGSIELIIANDHSPDATDEIVKRVIKNTLQNIKVNYTNHDINKGMIPNFIWALQQAKGDYIALCDGDDYWTDPLKLQKQVDFLEKNEEYGMVHTQISYKFGLSEISSISKTERIKNSFDELIRKNSIIPLTTCIRQKLIVHYLAQIDPVNKNWVAGDLPIWLWFSLYSKIYFLNEVTGMYRVVAGSASNTKTSEKYLEFIKSRRSIKEYFIKNHQINDELLQFVAEDFYKDAEFHVLKLKDKQVINEIGNYFYSKKKKMFLTLYFVMMGKIFNYKLLYQFWYNVYRVYYKFIKKHYKYEQ